MDELALEEGLLGEMRDALLRAQVPTPLTPTQRQRGLEQVIALRSDRPRESAPPPQGGSSRRSPRGRLLWALALAAGLAGGATGVGLTVLRTQPAPLLEREPRAAGVNPGLVPSPSGWLEGESNSLGIQGAFFVVESAGSEIRLPRPPTTRIGDSWAWENPGQGTLCLEGTATQVRNGDYATYWGVSAGFQLCARHDQSDLGTPLGDCPRRALGNLAGFSFTLSGSQIPEHLWVVFMEEMKEKAAYVPLEGPAAGSYKAWFRDARVHYLPNQPAAHPSRIRQILIQVPTQVQGPVPFNFCISNIQPLLASPPGKAE